MIVFMTRNCNESELLDERSALTKTRFDAYGILRQYSLMNPELETILNRLLEAERAGHQLLDAMAQETSDPRLKALFANFTEVEVGDVSVLEGLIRLHGGTPSTQTGNFVDRVLNLDNLHDQINLLSRGQAWVARKVEQALALNPPPDIAAFLKEMANRHRHNMEWARAEAIQAFDE